MPPTIQWRIPDATPDPAHGDLHLWRIATHAGGRDLTRCLALLGESQRQRAERISHAEPRERYIRAQAGLREILSLYLDEDPQRIGFEYGPAGKPVLRAPAWPLAFNLTTSGDLALVALGRDAELGVDCEWLRPRPHLEAIAARMFEARVVQSIRETPEAERLMPFYRAWTALEADAKCDGRGLFRARPPQAEPPEIRHCIPAKGYVAAIARATLPPVEEWMAYDLNR